MPGLPQFVEPRRRAESGSQVAGKLAAGEMPRLSALLANPGGVIEFQLRFGKNDQGLVCIEGDFSTSVQAICQRCLEPMTLRLARPIEVALVSDREQADRLGGELEPLTLSDDRLHLAGFIEDEVLLAMPFAPRHAADQCAAAAPQADAAPDGERHQPFRVLKDLQTGKT